jgi:hypothetical protein
MKKYLLTFFGGNTALRYSNLDKAGKEDQQKHLAAWGAWMTGLAKANKLEGGYPLESEGKRIGPERIANYHFPDTTEGGFIIIKAGSLDEAAQIAGSAPIIKNGGYVLARPCGETKQ